MSFFSIVGPKLGTYVNLLLDLFGVGGGGGGGGGGGRNPMITDVSTLSLA